VQVHPDGSYSYDQNYGLDHKHIEQQAGGFRNELTTYANGDTTTVSTDSKGRIYQVAHTDVATGQTELVQDDGNGHGRLMVYDTNNPDNFKGPYAISDVKTNPDGSYSYTTDGGVHVEAHADDTRIDTIKGPDGQVHPTYVQWREKDTGEVSSRTYKYDDNGNLVEATGTGTAKNEHWTQNPDGTMTREADGLTVRVNVAADGTFSVAYSDENHNLTTFSQKPDGTASNGPTEVQKDQPIGNGNRRADIDPTTGAMHYVTHGGDNLWSIASDVLRARHPDKDPSVADINAMIARIAHDNGIADPNKIDVNEPLTIV
jgi:hypothetical protein